MKRHVEMTVSQKIATEPIVANRPGVIIRAKSNTREHMAMNRDMFFIFRTTSNELEPFIAYSLSSENKLMPAKKIANPQRIPERGCAIKTK